MEYNEAHGIIPRTVLKSREEILSQQSILDIRGPRDAYLEPDKPLVAADPVLDYMDRAQLEKTIADTERKMKKAAKELDFISAAQFRDELFALKAKLKAL
jgi:excinuclease ABC subunit B